VVVDGCFWHGCPVHGTWPKANAAWWREKILGNVARDRDTDARLTQAGWTVLRFWEHEEPVGAARKMARIVRRR
jgi:DNA mismatch endonuclease (patch repair protein)